jgi:enediyne biosynthesis protein E4
MQQQQTKSVLYSLIILGFIFAYSLANAQTKFSDATTAAGIDHQFVVYEGMFGGGACVIDFNNDGWEDLYLTGGMNDDVLYLNNGNGTFTNVFETSGLADTRKYVTQGVASSDVNKDGWPDLFITTITTRGEEKEIPRAENLFFINQGNSTFRNATEEYGLQSMNSFSTGVSFGDFNLDGYPDAYVGNYFIGYEGSLTQINDATIVNANQTAEGYLLLNDAGKRFENVYGDYGLKYKGFGFGAVFTDFDNDHDPDLFVNHDFGYKATANVMLKNKFPKEQFVDIAGELGLDLKINAMGTAVGDYDNNGWFDYFVTNIRFNRFMVNQGPGKPFADRSKALGMDYVSISWGANFADFDNDTDLDLYVANGDLNPNGVPLADYYFENTNRTFTESGARVGLNDYGIGRGSVVFDYDHDGDLDIVVVNQKPVVTYPVSSKTAVYKNESASGNWFKVQLKGVQADRQGIGSLVRVTLDTTRMIREIDGGSGHLSQNSVVAHFGIGNATMVDSVIVIWPGGKQQVYLDQPANTLITIMEVPEEKESSSSFLIAAVIVLSVLTIFFISKLRRKLIPRGIPS